MLLRVFCLLCIFFPHFSFSMVNNENTPYWETEPYKSGIVVARGLLEEVQRLSQIAIPRSLKKIDRLKQDNQIQSNFLTCVVLLQAFFSPSADEIIQASGKHPIPLHASEELSKLQQAINTFAQPRPSLPNNLRAIGLKEFSHSFSETESLHFFIRIACSSFLSPNALSGLLNPDAWQDLGPNSERRPLEPLRLKPQLWQPGSFDHLQYMEVALLRLGFSWWQDEKGNHFLAPFNQEAKESYFIYPWIPPESKPISFFFEDKKRTDDKGILINFLPKDGKLVFGYYRGLSEEPYFTGYGLMRTQNDDLQAKLVQHFFPDRNGNPEHAQKNLIRFIPIPNTPEEWQSLGLSEFLEHVPEISAFFKELGFTLEQDKNTVGGCEILVTEVEENVPHDVRKRDAFSLKEKDAEDIEERTLWKHRKSTKQQTKKDAEEREKNRIQRLQKRFCDTPIKKYKDLITFINICRGLEPEAHNSSQHHGKHNTRKAERGATVCVALSHGKDGKKIKQQVSKNMIKDLPGAYGLPPFA